MTEVTEHSRRHECKGSRDRTETECIICTQVKEKYKIMSLNTTHQNMTVASCGERQEMMVTRRG